MTFHRLPLKSETFKKSQMSKPFDVPSGCARRDRYCSRRYISYWNAFLLYVLEKDRLTDDQMEVEKMAQYRVGLISAKNHGMICHKWRTLGHTLFVNPNFSPNSAVVCSPSNLPE